MGRMTDQEIMIADGCRWLQMIADDCKWLHMACCEFGFQWVWANKYSPKQWNHNSQQAFLCFYSHVTWWLNGCPPIPNLSWESGHLRFLWFILYHCAHQSSGSWSGERYGLLWVRVVGDRAPGQDGAVDFVVNMGVLGLQAHINTSMKGKDLTLQFGIPSSHKHRLRHFWHSAMCVKRPLWPACSRSVTENQNKQNLRDTEKGKQDWNQLSNVAQTAHARANGYV